MQGEVRREFANAILYVVLVNSLVFAFIGVLHEAGHALYGVLVGCTGVQIVLFDVSSGSTYTKMACAGGLGGPEIFLSSFILVLPAAALAASLKGTSLQHLGLILLGGNLLGSVADLAAVTSWVPLHAGVAGLGILLMLHGQNWFAAATITEQTGADITPTPLRSAALPLIRRAAQVPGNSPTSASS